MDEPAGQLLRKMLKERGASITSARLFVYELLWGKEPQSMGELTHRLDGKIDRASLYRTIELFEKIGVVQRIYMGWKYKVELSDVFTHHHHHISCVKCGQIKPITESDQLEQLLQSIATEHGYEIQSHQLEIQGLCKTCQS